MVRFHVCLVTPQIARSKRLLVTGGCRQSTLLQPISIAGLLVKEVKAFLIFHRKPMILLRALSTTQFTAVWGVKDDAKPAHSCRVRALLVRLWGWFGGGCEKVVSVKGLLCSLAVFFGKLGGGANPHLVKGGERFALCSSWNIFLLLLILDSYDTLKLFSLRLLPIQGIPWAITHFFRWHCALLFKVWFWRAWYMSATSQVKHRYSLIILNHGYIVQLMWLFAFRMFTTSWSLMKPSMALAYLLPGSRCRPTLLKLAQVIISIVTLPIMMVIGISWGQYVWSICSRHWVHNSPTLLLLCLLLEGVCVLDHDRGFYNFSLWRCKPLLIHIRCYPKVNSAFFRSSILCLLYLLIMIHLMRSGCRNLWFLLYHQRVTMKQRGTTKPFGCCYNITRKLYRAFPFTQPSCGLLRWSGRFMSSYSRHH